MSLPIKTARIWQLKVGKRVGKNDWGKPKGEIGDGSSLLLGLLYAAAARMVVFAL